MKIYSPILAKHFNKLGLDDAFFDTYESVAKDKMQNIDKICEMLHDIYLNHRKIAIYTDFDVDGIMSSVVAHAGLSELGFDTILFEPSPSDGYGFRIKDVDNILAQNPDVSVILTGDVGTSCNDAVTYAKSKGITVLVTDHHISDEPCAADVTVNPNQFGETYSHNGICGSYVLYIILDEYAKRYCNQISRADIYRLQVFAGIATVSDVMPLIYENRQLVRNSVGIMRYFFKYDFGTDTELRHTANYTRAFIGLSSLLEYFQQCRKIKNVGDIDEKFYSFYLIPFLNSCKRMNGNMMYVYDIFFNSRVTLLPGFEDMRCVATGIRYLSILNERRKTVTTECFEQLMAEKEAGESANSEYMDCEVYIADIGSGICGLLANKFMDMTCLPTMVLVENEDGTYTGSGRCPGWADIRQRLSEYKIPVSCMGHKGAFGVFIPDKNVLNQYKRFFKKIILPEFEKMLESNGAESRDIVISNVFCRDRDFYLNTELIKEYLDEKEQFHPFGHAFPEPEFKLVIDSNSVHGEMFGKDNQHYRLVTNDGIEILLYYQALDTELLKYYNKGKRYAWVIKGSFGYDSYDVEYDTISFNGNSIDVMEMK